MKNKVYYPFILALFPVFFLYSFNVGEVKFSEILPSLFTVLGFSLFLYLVFYLIFKKSSEKSALATFFILFLIFSYGHIASVVYPFHKDYYQISDLYLITLWIVLIALVIFWVGQLKKDLKRINVFLSLVSLVLIIFPLVNIGFFQLKNSLNQKKSEMRTPQKTLEAGGESLVQNENLPDIYYIILDRYASKEILKERYGFDNSKFIRDLRSKGFYVAEKSFANYPKTAHSLASSLNMDYLNFGSESGNNWRPIFDMLKYYKAWSLLKERGYKFIHMGSWWQPTSENSYADENINIYPLPEFSLVLYKTTFFYPLGKIAGIFNERLIQYQRVKLQFEKLESISQDSDPTFVFVHFLVPHDPYVFNEDGSFVSETEETRTSENDKYINQVKFVNSKLINFIDKTLNGQSKSIIILQSDEGPHPERHELDPLGFNWNEATNEELKLKMGIFNAYLFPGVDKSVFYSSITPVNSFRLLFNSYFGTDYDILEDRAFVFEDYNHPFKFYDVTDKLRN